MRRLIAAAQCNSRFHSSSIDGWPISLSKWRRNCLVVDRSAWFFLPFIFVDSADPARMTRRSIDAANAKTASGGRGLAVIILDPLGEVNVLPVHRTSLPLFASGRRRPLVDPTSSLEEESKTLSNDLNFRLLDLWTSPHNCSDKNIDDFCTGTCPWRKTLQNHLSGQTLGDYCTPLRGIMEITPTEGQIMCPEGCIMPQRDAVDRRSRHPEGA